MSPYLYVKWLCNQHKVFKQATKVYYLQIHRQILYILSRTVVPMALIIIKIN